MRVRRLLAGIGVAALIPAGALLASSMADTPVAVSAPPMTPMTPAPTHTPTPSPSSSARVDPVLAAEIAGRGWLLVPRLELRIPLGTMPVTEGVVDPPDFDRAFLVDGYGSVHGTGTAYVAMHSSKARSAPGNGLIDLASGTSPVIVGEPLIVDSIPYVVTEVRVIDKPAIVDEPDLWVPLDGRLVIFTCLQRPEGRSVQNVVIIADRVTL